MIESTLPMGTVLVVELPEPCAPEPHEPTPETETATARGKTATEGATVDVEQGVITATAGGATASGHVHFR